MSKASGPLVSVCVPTRNRAVWLRESLRTIQAQDYDLFEILISDNASVDETPRICRELAAADARVRYLRQDHDVGLHANHNILIQESRGELLTFYHDDDLYDPAVVRESVSFLQRHRDVGLVCSDWNLVDDHGDPIGRREFRGRHVLPGREYVERTIRSGRSSLTCSGTMVRRSALGATRFDERGPLGFGDFVVWFQIAERWAVGHIPKRLWSYRIHRDSLSRRTIFSVTRDYETVLRDYYVGYRKRWPSHGAVVARWERAMERFLFWALVYEVGRHVSRLNGHRTAGTIFDVMDYALTEQEFQEALGHLRAHERGWLRPIIRRGIEAMVHSRRVWPLQRLTSWAPRCWALLNR